ncbi:MAG: ABC transporter permease [Hyphomicrobiales bacterium]|nr:ABC transporter permease [Hyphomicrobiales bacterium]
MDEAKTAEERQGPVRSDAAPRRPEGGRDGGRRRRASRRSDPGEGGGTIVPPQSVAGRALVSVVAIMCFLACLAVGALSVVRDAARDWQVDVSREATIQVKPIGGTGLEMRLARALALARDTAGVRSARLIDERESDALLEPWLGKGLDLGSLPVPRLVVLELEDPATADLGGLRSKLAQEVEGAALDDHAVWAARLRTMAGAAVLVGAVVVALMLAATALSVVFATRAAMAGNRDVIEVLHFVGAEDAFIAREFRRHFLALALGGGLIGGGAALALFVVADLWFSNGRGDPLADQARALFGGVSIGWGGFFGVIGVVAIVTALTGVTSRATVLGHLRRLE